MSKIIEYLRGSVQEMNNVTWPTKKQAVRITMIVFVFMILSAFALGLVDQLFGYGYQVLLSLN